MKGIREWMEGGSAALGEASVMSAKEVKAAFEKGIGRFKKEIADEMMKRLQAPKIKDVYATFAFKRNGKDIESFSPMENVSAVRTAVQLLYGAICFEMGLSENDVDKLVAKAYGFNLKDVQDSRTSNIAKSARK